MTTRRDELGGIIHTYQRYDPAKFPSPTQPPPDLVSPAFEHMLAYGSMRELTDEELARAIHLDPSQIAGLGPSLDFLKQLLEERKRKILETYETERARRSGRAMRIGKSAERLTPPSELRDAYQRAVKEEQLRELERLWYRAGGERSRFAAQLMQVIERLGDKYQVDELAAKYAFTGRDADVRSSRRSRSRKSWRRSTSCSSSWKKPRRRRRSRSSTSRSFRSSPIRSRWRT